MAPWLVNDLVAGATLRHAVAGYFEDAILVVVLVLMVPLAILIVGSPVVLCVRAAIEVLRRF